MFMFLTEEGQQTLKKLIDSTMRELLDWTDFIEDSGVPLYIVEHYLNCEKTDVTYEHLFGLARAMRMSFLDLYCKLSWQITDEDVEEALLMKENANGSDSDETTIISIVDMLEEWASECIEEEKMKEFGDPYNKLWDIFDESTSEKLRKKIAPKIADLTYRSGILYHKNSDFLGLCGQYNASYSFVKQNPEFPEGALTCVMLAVGVFEKKFAYREFENVESYIDELVPITKYFPENEELTLQSAICLCNLLQLCPYDYGVFAGRMIEIVDQTTSLAERFPKNMKLQLCYLRSLVFFLCYGKPRLKDEIYEKYYEITEDAFERNKDVVSDSDFADMRYALRENDIFFDR